jgi:hypothetical protein
VGYIVKEKELLMKFNGPFLLPRERWEWEIVSKSTIFLTREEAEEHKDTYYPNGFVVEVPEEPFPQKRKCESCGKNLPHYVEVIADDGYIYYICPRCNYESE